MKKEYDRGAFDRLRFERCARGFVLFADAGPGLIGEMFAFDRVEDVGAWLVEQYGPPNPATCKHLNGGIAEASRPDEAWCVDCGAFMEPTHD